MNDREAETVLEELVPLDPPADEPVPAPEHEVPARRGGRRRVPSRPAPVEPNGRLLPGVVEPVGDGPDTPSAPLADPESAQERAGCACGEPAEMLSRPSAQDVTEERMLRAPAPDHGWRGALHRLTGGRLRPGLSEAQRWRLDDLATLRTAVRGSRTVAVVSTKGGVGKTTTTALLGHTFATHRGDRIVALDGNPDAGSLGHRIRRETSATADDLLRDADRATRYSDVRAFTSQAPSRLEVLAALDDPRASHALGQQEYDRLLALLWPHYSVVLVDCGTGILGPATRGIVTAADQLVVVTGASLDAARATSYLLDWLERHDLAALVDGSIAVINSVQPRSGTVDVDEIHDHFADRCRSVVRIPWDPHLATGAHTALEECAHPTRDAYVQLAAAVAVGFTTTITTREAVS